MVENGNVQMSTVNIFKLQLNHTHRLMKNYNFSSFPISSTINPKLFFNI